MARVYGDEQRKLVRSIRSDLIEKIELVYLAQFEQLHKSGLGDGVIAKLTQLMLISRDGALAPLKKDI